MGILFLARVRSPVWDHADFISGMAAYFIIQLAVKVLILRAGLELILYCVGIILLINGYVGEVQTMSKISLYLHGTLKEFGGPFHFFACHAAEAISALSGQILSFETIIAKGRFHLISGAYRSGKILKGSDCYRPLKAQNLHIVPVASGMTKSTTTGCWA